MSTTSSAHRVVISILGELRVQVDGLSVVVPRGLSSAVLFLLALDPGAELSDAQLLDRLWSDPPRNALPSLRNTIARLRGIIGNDAIMRTTRGYMIATSVCSVDLQLLRDAAATARALSNRGRVTDAAALLGGYIVDLRLPLSIDLFDTPFAERSVAELEEELWAIEEQWMADAILAEPDPHDVARILGAARRAPLREQRWVMAIETLASVGRRAEALRTVEECRQALLEVGLEPGERLVEAERRAIISEPVSSDLAAQTRRSLKEELRRTGTDDLLLLDCELSDLDAGLAPSDDLGVLVDRVISKLHETHRCNEAIRIGKRWLALGGARSTEPLAISAQITLATCMLSVGDADEATVLLDVAEQRARVAGLVQLEADALLARGPIDTGHSRALPIAERAEGVLDRLDHSDIDRSVRLATWAAHHWARIGDREHATVLVDRVREKAATSSNQTLHSLVIALDSQIELLVGGSPVRFRTLTSQLRAWASLTNDPTAVAASAVFASSLTMLDGEPRGLDRCIDLLRVANEVVPRPDLRWMEKCTRAAHLLMTGAPCAEAITDAERLGTATRVEGAAAAAQAQRFVAALFDGSLGVLLPLLRPSEDDLIRAEPASIFGLCAVAAGNDAAIADAVEALLRFDRPIRSAGIAWPLVAFAAADLALTSGDVELARRCCIDLAPWSGHGLSMMGICYLGSTDGLLTAFQHVLGNSDTAKILFDSALRFERRIGATPFADRLVARLGPVLESPPADQA